MNVLENRVLNITENDIMFETDIDILNEWLLSIRIQIQLAKDSILEANLRYNSNEDVDSKWYRKLVGYKRILTVLELKIANQIRIVKAENNKNASKTNDRILIEEFKKQLSNEEFIRIVNIAKDKYIK